VGSSDFKIKVFNKNGDPLYTISTEYERVKLTEEFIDTWFNRIKRNIGMETYHILKQWTSFPEFFPAIFNLIIDIDYIHVLTYRRKENQSELLI
jgi:hypothetical protein